MAFDPSCGQCLRISQFNIDPQYVPNGRMFENNDRKILLRQHAISVIAKVAKMSNPPDAYVPYLAMNYFDRFLFRFDITAVPGGLTATEKVCLTAVSCYTLSANRRATGVRNLVLHKDILVALDRDMDLTRITKSAVWDKQYSITLALNNKMTPVTAFWFLDHYYDHFKLLGVERRSVNEIVVQAQGDHTFVGFKPTDIAFSACVAAATIALKELPKDIKNMISNEVQEIVNKMVDLCNNMNILIVKTVVAAEVIEAEMGKVRVRGKVQPQMEGAITVTPPTEHMNFELKWATDVPPLEDSNVPSREAQPPESIGCTCNIS
ncbi:unnamed protein product [Trifolium pratense]|uniref:Uncharacterized protein n=1 Tax=Trifolium pratense TaxID=57577 RepID=A0ACB0KXH9_TRIPR|nr:unnamed protein product [Trifolium pratense]